MKRKNGISESEVVLLTPFVVLFLLFGTMSLIAWSDQNNCANIRQIELNATKESKLVSSSFQGEVSYLKEIPSGYKLREVTRESGVKGEWILTFKNNLVLRGFDDTWYYYPSGNGYYGTTSNLETIWRKLEWGRKDKTLK